MGLHDECKREIEELKATLAEQDADLATSCAFTTNVIGKLEADTSRQRELIGALDAQMDGCTNLNTGISEFLGMLRRTEAARKAIADAKPQP